MVGVTTLDTEQRLCCTRTQVISNCDQYHDTLAVSSVCAHTAALVPRVRACKTLSDQPYRRDLMGSCRPGKPSFRHGHGVLPGPPLNPPLLWGEVTGKFPTRG